MLVEHLPPSHIPVPSFAFKRIEIGLSEICEKLRQTLIPCCLFVNMALFSLVLFLEAGLHYVAQASLELMILLTLPPECQNYKCMSQDPSLFFKKKKNPLLMAVPELHQALH
jgi:hypothetical protein